MTKSHKGSAQVYDASKGEQALAALQSRVQAFRVDALELPRVDLELVAIMLLGVSDRIGPMRARFESLPKREFDATQLDLLEPLAWALWYVDKQVALQPASEAKIPADLVSEASQVEARMQACCEYHLLDDAIVGPTLLALRPGTGHRDLAGDLAGYAEIYRTHHAIVSQDRKNYRPGDEKRAVEIATKMLKLLGASADASPWTETRNRVWTLAVQTYTDIAKTGDWLLRNEIAGAAAFPNLYLSGRSPAARATAAEPLPDPPAQVPPPAAPAMESGK